MKKNNPALLKAILWGTFSGTATISAFTLPAFIIGHLFQQQYNDAISPLLLNGGIWLILLCALYHSVYRTIASNHDLKLLRTLALYITGYIVLTIIFILIS